MNLVSKYSYIELCNLLIGKRVNFKSDCQLFDNFDVTGKVINIDISKTKVSMLPASVFKKSIYLTKVILCDGLKVIDYECFRNCEELKEINLPKTIARIGRNVFYRCDQLSEIKYEGTLADWKKVEKDDAYDTESVLYSKC